MLEEQNQQVSNLMVSKQNVAVALAYASFAFPLLLGELAFPLPFVLPALSPHSLSLSLVLACRAV
jgi:hypothetical protein